MIDRDEIKRRRTALGLTLDEAAKRAGFNHRQRWSGIERGERSRLATDTLLAVAKALECSMEDLLVKPKAAPTPKARGRAKGKR